nr:MAG TPA: hypothetical protein [Caudoviricetes sp.]
MFRYCSSFVMAPLSATCVCLCWCRISTRARV